MTWRYADKPIMLFAGAGLATIMIVMPMTITPMTITPMTVIAMAITVANHNPLPNNRPHDYPLPHMMVMMSWCAYAHIHLCVCPAGAEQA
jgi:hypothetical protein